MPAEVFRRLRLVVAPFAGEDRLPLFRYGTMSITFRRSAVMYIDELVISKRPPCSPGIRLGSGYRYSLLHGPCSSPGR